MSDVDEQADLQEESLDDTSHQACYIFKPFATSDLSDRPIKKRKTKHEQIKSGKDLPLLSHGFESQTLASRRYTHLQRSWEQKQNHIDQFVVNVNATVREQIIDFARAGPQTSSQNSLRTGLIVSGPDSGAQTLLAAQWKALSNIADTEIFVHLRTSVCPNLQTSLKNVIKAAISAHAGPEGYSLFVAKHKRLLPLNFDLELLQQYVQEKKVEKIIVSVIDVETFDTAVLCQILSTLHAWKERIPFVVLLGIATTIELFETRLPKSVLELLDAEVFFTSSSSDMIHSVFSLLQHDHECELFLGPSTLSVLRDLAQNQSTTVETFTNIVKIAYVSHYFANSLSSLLGPLDVDGKDVATLCEAIRHTRSFRRHCEVFLEQGQINKSLVRDLLNDDQKLLSTARDAITHGQEALRGYLAVTESLRNLREGLNLGSRADFSEDLEMYNQATSLAESEIFEETITTIENLPSTKLLSVLEKVKHSTVQVLGLDTIIENLGKFQAVHKNASIQFSLESSNGNTATRTPSKKASKTNQAPSSLSLEAQYAQIIKELTAQLSKVIESHKFDFTTFMHEAFIINSRQPLLSLFTPQPRHAIERALSKPADYLGCNCSTEHSGQSSTHEDEDEQPHISPPTSILYNLLQETGTIINVRDLFDAFESRLTHPPSSAQDDDDDNDNDNNEKQRLSLCLFYRSLSELKMLGMVKSSTSTMIKKRALASEGGAGVVGKGKKAYAEIDFIAKTSWAGL